MKDSNEFKPHADMCAVMQMILPTSHLYFITTSRAPSSLCFPLSFAGGWSCTVQWPKSSQVELHTGASLVRVSMRKRS